MPPQDANPTPSFGGFGLIDSAELDELREAIGRTVKMIRKIRELNLVDPTELQPLFRPYASDGPNE